MGKRKKKIDKSVVKVRMKVKKSKEKASEVVVCRIGDGKGEKW